MADNNIDDEVEKIKKQLAELGINYDENIRNLIKRGKSEEDAIKETKKLAVTFAESAKLYKKSAVDIKQSMDDLKKSINKGEVSAEELSDQLNTLRDQINKTSDQGKKQALLDAKVDLESLNARNKAHAALKDSLWNMAGVLTVGAANAFKGVTTKALSGADAFDIAGSMMTAGVDLINSANQGGANSLKSFGAATAGAGGKLGAAGRAASVFGEVLGFASAGLSDLAKAGIGFMLAQTKQLIAGFQSMSSAGAIYSGGMLAMTNTALSANMTLEQFSKAVSANSVNLAKTGLGVAEASKRMAGAMQEGGKSARKGMFALGMGLEEQADAYAMTMATMAGPSGKLKSSNAEVAAQTQEYAKNLKIISSLTGEDIKAKQDKIRQELDSLFMKQKLDEMEPKQRAKFRDMLDTMNDDQRRQLTERMKYNGVISKDLGAAEALSSGFRSAGDKFYQAWKDQSASGEVGRKIQAESAEQIKKDAKNQREISIANSEIAVGTSKVLAGAWTTSASMTEEGLKAAEEAANAQIAAGKQGKDLGANNLEMLQSNMIEMQTLAVKNMDKFQRALDLSYNAAMAAVRSLTDLGTAAANNPIKTGLLAILPAIVGTIAPLLLTKIFGGKFGVLGASAANPMHVTSGGFGGPGAAGGVDKTGRYRDSKGRFAKAPTGGIVKSGLNSLKTLAGKAGIAGAVISTGMAAKDLYDTEQDTTLTKGEKREKQGGIVGGGVVGAGGAIAGAKMGAMLGSFGGPVGIAIGGLLGAGIGYYIGQKGGEIVGKAIMKDKSANSTVAAATAVAASGATTQITAPKPVAGTSSQNLAAEQTKLYGAVVDPAAAAAKAKAMEKPVASANPAEQQQITLLQTILATLQKSNTISSGILQNSY